MTFEEMQKIIQEMLSVQRDLQETQIKQQATVGDLAQRQEQFAQNIENQQNILQELIERYGDLAKNSERQQTILDQLIGYSINAESDRLDLQEQLNLLKQKVEKIEKQKS